MAIQLAAAHLNPVSNTWQVTVALPRPAIPCVNCKSWIVRGSLLGGVACAGVRVHQGSRHAFGRCRTASRCIAAATTVEGKRTALVIDHCSKDLLDRLRAAGCCAETRSADETVEEALTRTRPIIAIVRSSQLQKAQLSVDGAEDLRLVMRAGAGVDNIDVDFLQTRGVTVANAAGANGVAVAELTMAHLLNADRRLADQVASLRRGEWRRLDFARGARGLQGQSLAILGFGSIGRAVAIRAQAFGMKVRAWDMCLTADEAAELGVVWCKSAADAVRGSYALTVHLPLTERTRGLVSAELLELLPTGGLVVNMARGGVVDEAALLHAVKDKGLRAGLDVFEQEPDSAGTTFADARLRDCEHIYGTHHTGARTAQAAEAVEDAVIQVVTLFLRGDTPVPGQISPSE
eukprot:TRINITY_DN45164_c0_g1_i1.p1 TRINITY_DN45164_c0_g1~~TRINITY_DN45164_c0_g1_i1.p1  ORF type:complete len:405 (+),score=46.87 TRINITY_DN45164_c0_g1_i1:148-1362(+)